MDDALVRRDPSSSHGDAMCAKRRKTATRGNFGCVELLSLTAQHCTALHLTSKDV